MVSLASTPKPIEIIAANVIAFVAPAFLVKQVVATTVVSQMKTNAMAHASTSKKTITTVANVATNATSPTRPKSARQDAVLADLGHGYAEPWASLVVLI